MIILSIETSCDETAVSILRASGTITSPKFSVLGNALYSQVKIHEKYGGVFPNIAKREHSKNFIPLLKVVLKESGLLKKETSINKLKAENKIQKILERETELLEQFLKFIPTIKIPKIDAIAVTYGPGLEPALWVGINAGRALGEVWGIPVIPVDHMEGHIVSVLFQKTKNQLRLTARSTDRLKTRPTELSGRAINYPSLSLLISGGHTELIYSKTPLSYKMIGKTRDDALGEAYDKVARMLGLPYPGGPEVSKLAEGARQSTGKNSIKKRYQIAKKFSFPLPRPMLYTKDYDFSFSGLKTAVLYRVREYRKLSADERAEIALEFESAITEIIIAKTRKAIDKLKPKSLILGGGVTANLHIQKSFRELAKEYPGLNLFIPSRELSTDNSIMIGMAGYLRIKKTPSILKSRKKIVAKGNATLG